MLANADATRGGLVSDADKRLADAYAGIFRAFLKHRDSVKMVTFWGANDAVSWRRFGTPLLFDGDNKPKPAFDAVIRVVPRPRWKPNSRKRVLPLKEGRTECLSSRCKSRTVITDQTVAQILALRRLPLLNSANVRIRTFWRRT